MDVKKIKFFNLFFVLMFAFEILSMTEPTLREIFEQFERSRKYFIYLSQVGNNELIDAALKGNEKKLVKLIRQKKYDINAVNSKGCTALHVAILNNKKESVKILLENGVDLSIKVLDRDALKLAIKRLEFFATSDKEYEEIIEIIELLIPRTNMKTFFHIKDIMDGRLNGNSNLFLLDLDRYLKISLTSFQINKN